MKNRKLRVLGTCLLIFAGIIVGSYGVWRYRYSHSRVILQQAKESFEQDLSRSLPIGSDRRDVLAFLDARQITQRNFGQVTDNDPRHEGAAEIVQAKTTDIITPLYQCSIYIEFRFDKKAKLIGYTDKMPCSGQW